MDGLSVSLILDLLLVCLLGATILFCIRLNKKLSVMREAQGELHKVAAEFDQAIVRSRLGIEELRNASQAAKVELNAELEIAKPLIEELKLINASSTRIADRLQEKVGNGSNAGATPTKTTTDRVEDPETDEPVNLQPRTEAERELLQMLTRNS